jgi:hypothetical protein
LSLLLWTRFIPVLSGFTMPIDAVSQAITYACVEAVRRLAQSQPRALEKSERLQNNNNRIPHERTLKASLQTGNSIPFSCFSPPQAAFVFKNHRINCPWEEVRALLLERLLVDPRMAARRVPRPSSVRSAPMRIQDLRRPRKVRNISSPSLNFFGLANSEESVIANA